MISAVPHISPSKAFVTRMTKLILVIVTALIIWLQHITSADARPAFSAISIDARTGKIIYAKNADSLRYPASLTKMMTLYMVFEELKAGRLHLDSKLRVSAYAASRPPSKLGLRAGKTIRVRHAISALVTKSANDVATVVAENLGGTESGFARKMTRKARSLGMTRTTFRNASGLPNLQQRSTARDMATLGLRLQRDFPRYFKYFSKRRFVYKGRRYGNHNRLLGRVRGVDGIKTGYTRASGYNLTSSVRRGKKRIVAVVMGGRTGRARNAYMTRLISKTFRSRRLSRGRGIALVAGKPPGWKALRKTKTRVAVKIKNPPLPRFKPAKLTDRIKPTTVATAAATTVIKKKPVATRANVGNTTFKTASILDDDKDLVFTQSEKQAPASRKSDLIVPKPEPKKPEIQKPALPSNHNKTWNIQIGAFPSKEGAKSRLQKAAAKANLKGKTAFTMEVKQDNGKLYRARFAGFNRKSARRACRVLARKGIGCFALAPRG